MVKNTPVSVNQIPNSIKAFGCLLILLVLPSTSEAALSVLFLLPFAAIFILFSAWAFGRSGLYVSTTVSLVAMATTAIELLSFL